MVVEFAKMDAARLLEETEKAVSHLHILYMYIHYSCRAQTGMYEPLGLKLRAQRCLIRGVPLYLCVHK